MDARDDLLKLRALESRWLALCSAHNPIDSARMGIDAFSEALGDFSAGSIRHYKDECSDILVELDEINDEDLDMKSRHDLLMMRADVGRQCLINETEPYRRAPYIYPELIGSALGCHVSDTTDTGRMKLNTCLRQAPAVFEQGLNNLDPINIPSVWLEMGLTAVSGLKNFLQGDLSDLAEDIGEEKIIENLQNTVSAAEEFEKALKGMWDSAAGEFAVGRYHIESLYENYHLLSDMNCEKMYEFGEKRIAESEQRMHHFAEQIAPGEDWQVALEKIKDDHPDPDDLLKAYRDARDAALEHIEENELITIVPEDEGCEVQETPPFMRSSIPLGVMNTSAPFSPDASSKLLITPIDQDADEKSRTDHLREQNYGFIKSITFHEIYPGHHLQSVLHKKVEGLIRKKFRSPLFVEGWGLYTEDLMEETGFLDTPELKFLQARNALWRAVRIIIDVGLHTGQMSTDEAIKLLTDRVGQGEHMARGEVLRYTRHDNATYQSCYMYGKTMLLKLRDEYAQKLGDEFSLGRFHDDFCAHGSPPLSLVREILLNDSESPEL